MLEVNVSRALDLPHRFLETKLAKFKQAIAIEIMLLQ